MSEKTAPMQLNIAIVDDERAERDRLSSLVRAWSEQSGSAVILSQFSSAEAFLFEHEQDNIFDILLLDIEMGLTSGIDLAKRIRRNDRRAEIVFITSHFEWMGEGYEVDARHFLIKPVNADKLSEVLTRAAAHLTAEPPAVLIKTDGETVKLETDRILYVESFLHYICIYTEDGTYKVKESISVFAEQLGDRFFRTHRSYLVALNRIVRISRTEVTLEDGTTLPLSRGLYDGINRAFIEQN